MAAKPAEPAAPVAGVSPATGCVPPPGGSRASGAGGSHFNQPRRRKYHIGTRALATISASANG